MMENKMESATMGYIGSPRGELRPPYSSHGVLGFRVWGLTTLNPIS